jgi:hypothetical protein
MLRIVSGIVAGFFAWGILWFGSERILSAAWPEFGSHQAAFQAAIEHGAPFTSNDTFLLIHVVVATIVSVISGFLAASIAGETKRAPLILGVVLMVLGLLKLVMSWEYVPVWYHVIFTAILLPMTIAGAKLKPAS